MLFLKVKLITMIKKEKFVIGEPYSIIVRDGNRIMKISGNALSEDDVKDFINNGILTKEDVVIPDKKENLYPSFEDVVCNIDEKFFPWKYYTFNLYCKYPSVAKLLILKEYSNIACRKLKYNDVVYLVSLSDGKITEFKASKDIVNNYAFFPTEESAKTAYDSVMKGVTCFIKS